MESNIILGELKLIESYLKNQAIRFTKDLSLAEDLVQETFYKVFSKIHLFKEGTNFKNWTTTIMKNIFINNYRKNKRMRLSPIEYETEISAISHEKNQAEFNLFESEIRMLVKTLSRQDQLIVNLLNEGYKYEEIAKILKMPVGSVKSKIHIIRRKLKIKYQKLQNVK